MKKEENGEISRESFESLLSFSLSFFLFFWKKNRVFFLLEIIHRHRKNDIVPVKITG